MNNYDSSIDTLKHIKRVNHLLLEFCIEMQKRAIVHDDSKLYTPEKEAFDEMTPLLAGVTYGSPEYKEMLKRIQPAINHHQKNNSHHPEFYDNGVDGMDLFDLVEMFFDWKAAGERHNDGNIYKSIDYNKTRFNMSEQLCNIFTNTATKLNY
jgi:hypothetical protein